MSKNFIEAALLQLKGQGVAHLAAIETMVSSPAGVADHTTHVDDIMKHARGAAECDEAVRILQRYFAAYAPDAPNAGCPSLTGWSSACGDIPHDAKSNAGEKDARGISGAPEG